MTGVTEVAGTISTFGQQVLSTKPSQPQPRIGTGGRIEATCDAAWEPRRLGTVSQGVLTQVRSGFGQQVPSTAQNAPQYRFGSKYKSDLDMQKEGRPGPGAYEATVSTGKQPLSANPSQPSWKAGQGNRFGQYSTIWKGDFQTPAAQAYRPAAGWLGDSPKYSFHGTGKRSEIAEGLVGNKPTALEDPGPGTYEVPMAMGTQHDSRKPSAMRTRVGTADRHKITKTQFISVEHEKDLYGKHSPSPGLYDPTTCLTKTSRVPTPASYRFGSSDRFSQIKPRSAQAKLPNYFAHPGPGTYVV